MTEQEFKDRVEILEFQRRQAEANLNAIAGAMQECQYWLQKITDNKVSIVSSVVQKKQILQGLIKENLHEL